MIVLSAGMPKSGTGWYFFLTNDLLVAAGFEDVNVVRDRFHLHSIMQFQNCYIGTPTVPKLALLSIPHLMGHRFPVKTHTNPLPSLQYLMRTSFLRATYIYRDPRDAALSAFEFGQKIRESLPTNPLAQLECLEDVIPMVKEWLLRWERWMRCERALMVRYEDLVADPVNELERLASHLSVSVPNPVLQSIAARYQPGPGRTDLESRSGLHFNKGEVGRFRRVMNRAQLDLCREHLGEYVRMMGYPD